MLVSYITTRYQVHILCVYQETRASLLLFGRISQGPQSHKSQAAFENKQCGTTAMQRKDTLENPLKYPIVIGMVVRNFLS